MIRISFLMNYLSSKIIRTHITYKEMPDIEGIILLKNQTALPAAGYLFIANGEDLRTILDSITPAMPATILTSGNYGEELVPENFKNINLIATSMDIFDLYNNVNAFVQNYKNWSITLMKAFCEGRDLKYIISKASAELNASIFLLNQNYDVICSNTNNLVDDIYINEMLIKGCLSQGSAEKLFGENLYRLNNSGCAEFVSDITRNVYYVEALTNKGSNADFLMAIYNCSQSPTVDVVNFVSRMAEYIKKSLLSENIEYRSDNAVFSSFISDIIELRLTEEEDIENRLKLISYPLNTFYSCIVIQFRSMDLHKIPYNYIISQLEQILPENNITVYDGDIVILYSYNERTWHFKIDYGKFEELLIRYDAFAGISNGTSHYSKIRTMYLLSKSTINLGIVLRDNKSKRIFTHEEYSMYCIIDLCAKNFYERYKHDDIVYLSHPAIIALARYDWKYKSNLRDILFHYLINDRNLNKTSKALYMHRNTLLYKIKKIEEIVGESLDNGNLQLRLLFSYLLFRYDEEYKKANIPYRDV